MESKLYTPKLIDYLHMKAGKKGIPLSGTFELTPICNMQCKMCYIRMTPEAVEQSRIQQLNLEDWILLAKEAKKCGMLTLLLTGGEPFIWPDFRELYQELKKLGLVLTINSNGTLIDEKTVQWLQDDPPVRINITLYGASDKTYEKLCGNPRGYTQAVKAIHLLKEAGISVKLNCSVTPQNRQDIPQIIHYAKEQQLMLQATSYMFPPLRRDKDSIGRNERFTPEEAAKVSAEILYIQRGREWFQRHLEEARAGKALMSYESECEPKKREQMKCRAGKSSFWVTWDGRMLPCGMIEKPTGYPLRDGFQNAWKQVREQSEKIRLPFACAECNKKEQCRACAAMVYTETGTFSQKPQYLCQMQNAYKGACENVWQIMERNIE